MGAIGTIAVADALRPGRPGQAVLAGAVAGLTPMVLAVGGLGQNDGPAFAAAAALLAATLRVLRFGPTVGRAWALVALGTAAALTRASLLPLVALAALVWVGSALGRGRDALWWAAAVAGFPLLLAGWFYVRNVRLYGDVTGAAYLQDKFGRNGDGTTASVLLRPRFSLGIWQEMWGNFRDTARLGSGGIYIGSSRPVLGSSLVSGLLIAGTAVAGGLVAAWRARLATMSRSATLAWSLALAWLMASIVAVASFAAGGGTPHPRYLLPAHAVIAVLIVGGVASLVSPARAWLALVGGLGLIDLLLIARLHTAVAVNPGRVGLTLPMWMRALVIPTLVGAAVAAWVAARSALLLPDRAEDQRAEA